MGGRKGRTRALRIAGIAVGVPLGLAIALVMLFLIPPFREHFLGVALQQANRALPGRIRVEQLRWPTPGTLEARGLVWIAKPDTLARAERLRVRVDLRALLQRDVHLRSLEVRADRLDVAGIRERLSGSSSPSPASATRSPAPFPRTGSLAPLPSVSVDSFHLDLAGVSLDPTREPSSLSVNGRLDLRFGSLPHLELRDLTASHPATDLSLGPGDLAIDLGTRTATGQIAGRQGDEWEFVLSARTVRENVLALELREPGEGRDASAMLETTILNTGAVLDSLFVSGEVTLPRAERLAAFSALSPVLSALDPQEQPRWNLDGTVIPSRESRWWIRTGALASLDSASVRLLFRPDAFSARDLHVSAPGLSLRADWSADGTRHEGDVEARIDGVAWLRPWVSSLPDSVSLSFEAQARGSLAALHGSSRLRGSWHQGDVRAESLDVRVDGAFTGRSPLAYQLEARLNEWWVTGSGEVVDRDPWVVNLAPWSITASRVESPPTGAGRLTVQPADIEATAIRIVGELGEAELEGRWNAATGGTLAGGVEWPRPPALLLERITTDAALAESLRTRWAKRTPPRVDVEARADTSGAWTGQLRFALPQPDVFTPLLPDAVDVRSLSAPTGVIQGRGRGAEVTATLRAQASGWLDDLVAGLRTSAHEQTLDTLHLNVLGALVKGSARVEDGRVNGTAQLDVDDVARFRSVLPGLPADLDVAAAVDLRAGGPTTAPDMDVDASLRGAGPDWDLPALLAHAEVRGGAMTQARAWVADTLRWRDLRIDRLATEIRPLNDPVGAYLMSLEAHSDSLGLEIVAAVDAQTEAPRWTVQVDTLVTRWAERDLHTRRPFAMNWDPAAGQGAIRDLDLTGSLGELTMDGRLDSAAAQFRAAMDLRDPPRVPGVEVPAWGWPARVRGSVEVARRDSVLAQVRATGLRFGPLAEVAARVQVVSSPQGISGSFDVTDGAASPVLGTVALPYRLDVIDRTLLNGSDSWSADVTLTNAPVPGKLGDPTAWDRFLSGEDPVSARVDGEIHLTGDRGRADGGMSLALTFPEQPRLSGHGLTLDATLSSSGEGSAPGFAAQGRWLRAGKSTARVDIALPGVALSPADAAVDWGDSIDVRVQFTDWTLDEINGLLPPGTRVGGTLKSDLRAQGPRLDPSLSGWFDGRDLTASTSKGDRARAAGRLSFSGTAREPVVNGKLEVSQASLVIPQPPRALHSVEGDALLWKDRPDTAIVITEAAPSAAATVEAIRLGVEVAIPGACWIRGRGLDAEMAGDLALVLHQGRPRVEGSLRAVRGTFSFVGSRFTVERGVATFYGTEEPDPNLDILLSHQKGDVRALVRVTGRASSPSIDLTSEPPMEEADILAHLLFGRASSDLDREQTGFLQTQATAAVKMFAIPGLERELTSRLGVDLIRLDQREGTPDEMSVVVGKYLSPRTLLKYDQALDRGDDFSINLEYWISRHVRLEAKTSRQTQSGVRMNWSSDY